MRKLQYVAVLTSLALIAAAPVCRATDFNFKKASAEISPLDDKDRAKVDVEENKQALKELEIEKETGESGNDVNCGSVNIGNDNGNQSGTGRVAPHDTTVIVTGDVFNTASCGR